MGMLPDLIGFNLRCAQLALFQHFNATVGREGISVPQFGTLLLIEANPDVTQSAIAEALRRRAAAPPNRLCCGCSAAEASQK